MSGIIGNATSKSGLIQPLFLKAGKLNSLGYLKHRFFGAAYYLSGAKTIADGTYVEIDATWSKRLDTGASGSDDADVFGKFSGGRWTPTVSGYYLITYSAFISGIDDGEQVISYIRLNGASDSGTYGAYERNGSAASNFSISASGSVVFPMDTNDYISLWVYHNEGGGCDLSADATGISITYVGSSDL